jgi:hypothetical protein
MPAYAPTVNQENAEKIAPTATGELTDSREVAVKQLVSRATLAALTGLSRAGVTKACRGTLAPACHGSGIDVDHPAARAYLRRYSVTPASRQAAVLGAAAEQERLARVRIVRSPAEMLAELELEYERLGRSLARFRRRLARAEAAK